MNLKFTKNTRLRDKKHRVRLQQQLVGLCILRAMGFRCLYNRNQNVHLFSGPSQCRFLFSTGILFNVHFLFSKNVHLNFNTYPNTRVWLVYKTDRHDIAEILLKVALNTINQPNPRIGVSVEISLIGLYFRCLSFGWF